jgi:hypothetical protein
MVGQATGNGSIWAENSRMRKACNDEHRAETLTALNER